MTKIQKNILDKGLNTIDLTLEVSNQGKNININKEENNIDQVMQHEKPSNIVLDFIKKLSPLKIFNRDNKKEKEVNNSLNNDHSMNFLEKENIPSNEDSMKKTDEEIIINEETIINHDEKDKKIVTNEEKEEKKLEITNNKEVKPNLEEKKAEIKPEEDKSSSEIKKNEKKTVQIQSEMPGLDEKIDEKNSKDEENLEIPSFLRNQSN